MSVDLLVEIGTEELPARFVDGALEQMRDVAVKQLAELRLSYERLEVAGTPRRLALLVFGLAEKQDDLVREMKGPSAKVAFDESGAPTKAALGFARGQGVAVEDLEVRETDQGPYVFAVSREEGLPASAVLTQWLPEFVTSLHFPKSMRWGDGSLRFGRPIRWLVALLDGQVLNVSVEGVAAGNVSRGHRFLAPEPVVLTGPSEYVEQMRAAYVIVDAAERTAVVRDEVRKAAAAHGAQALEDEDLVAEVANLVEWPTAVVGSFDESYLRLPRLALITPMREHQRYFPLVDDAGRLLPQFITICNGPRDDLDVVRRGNEKVLAARLADAQFFYDEDRRVPLADYVARLKEVVFQEQLGTVYEKMERIRKLAAMLAEMAGADEATRQTVARGAYLAKADLVTQMVYEFPELQGVMGREYALLSGEGEAVADAVLEHYLPRFSGDELPSSLAGAILGIADKLDTIVGCFGVGLIPTGSQDPYALRRQALGVVRIVNAFSLDIDLDEALAVAVQAYGGRFDNEDGLIQSVLDFFRQRMRGMLIEQGVRHDLVEAVIGVGVEDVAGVFARAEALAAFSESPEFEALVTAHERAANLASKGDTDEISAELFQTDAERDLFAQIGVVRERLDVLVAAERWSDALAELAGLRPYVDRLFEDVMVMAPEEDLRRNRLALLRRTVKLFEVVADFRAVVA